ncbi:MAG: alpha/beta hydrolase [Acidimicrobiia bacterium]
MDLAVRDGARLAFEDRPGGPGTPVLFLHGAMSSRATFSPQMEHFGGRRRIALDLRGHGQSEVTEHGYDVPALARDAADLCDHLELESVVLIGHSLGGAAALQLAADDAARVVGLAILDSPIMIPPDFRAGVEQLAAAARSPMYDEAINGFLGQFAGIDEAVRRQVFADLANTPQEVVASCLESTVAFDSEGAATECRMPILYVSSGPWFADVGRFRDLCPQLVTAQTMGSGHYHHLEVPRQVNALLDRFLEINGL